MYTGPSTLRGGAGAFSCAAKFGGGFGPTITSFITGAGGGGDEDDSFFGFCCGERGGDGDEDDSFCL